MAYCKCCGVLLDDSNAYKRRDSISGYHATCRQCYIIKYYTIEEKTKRLLNSKEKYSNDIIIHSSILPQPILEYYIKNNISIEDISEHHNCTKDFVIATLKLYKLYNITYLSKYKYVSGLVITRRGRKTSEPLLDKEYLYLNYVTLKKSGIDIANETHISYKTILRYLHIYNIPVRDCKEYTLQTTKQKISQYYELNDVSGQNNPNWRGGKSFEPYCYKFTKELREQIRQKYNYKCILCGKLQSSNSRKLNIHHTDYNKMQGCKTSLFNLVPLCDSCHSKTNGNRWYWFNLLYHRYFREYVLDFCIRSEMFCW